MLLDIAQIAVDSAYASIPREKLTLEERASCKIVAHRGCPDVRRAIYENTLDAFDVALNAGAWGVEFDVQWTRDNVPVVIHDPHTGKLPGKAGVEICNATFEELRAIVPVVPTLKEVVERYGKRIHLMIELKSETIKRVNASSLQRLLQDLEPVVDFHLMALEPEIYELVTGFPKECLLLIAITNTRKMFEHAIQGNVGGLTGHYLLINKEMRRQLGTRNLLWGTGHVNSMNLLAREVRLGSTWIFSNSADKLSRKLQGSN